MDTPRGPYSLRYKRRVLATHTFEIPLRLLATDQAGDDCESLPQAERRELPRSKRTRTHPEKDPRWFRHPLRWCARKARQVRHWRSFVEEEREV